MSSHEAVAGFVLDALDHDEVRAFERHLEICPDCEDEIESFRLAAVALAFAGDLPVPRPELRLRVLAVGTVVIPFRRRMRRPTFAAAAAAAACAAVVVALTTPGDDANVAGLHVYRLGSTARLLVTGRGEAVLVQQMAPAPAGKSYEVWVIHDGKTMPAGLIGRSLVALTRPVPHGATVAVSLEPDGGSPRPTGPLILRTDTA